MRGDHQNYYLKEFSRDCGTAKKDHNIDIASIDVSKARANLFDDSTVAIGGGLSAEHSQHGKESD